MSWITITVADLEDARVAELVNALREEALGDTQTDPMPRFIQTTIDEVRRCISMWASTPVDVDATKIPAGLQELVSEKIVRRMKGRLLQPLTEDETKAEALYQKRLEMLTRGEWPVDKTDTPLLPQPVANHSGVEVAASTTRRFTRDSMQGL